jgi:hypothetical protein
MVQIHVIPPNQTLWVHLSFNNDGQLLIPLATEKKLKLASPRPQGTIATNAKKEKINGTHDQGRNHLSLNASP